MSDPTETARRILLAAGVPERDCAAAERRLTTDELCNEYEVHSFLAPFVFVTRKRDGAKGTLMFTHSPRRYFDFKKDEQS